MDIDFSSLVFLLSFGIFLAMFLRMKTQSKPESELRFNLPPGPRKLPLIGNLHQLLGSFEPPHRTLSNLARKHGPVMHLQLGQVSTIVISSPEGAKEVTKTHDIILANRPSFLTTEILFYNNSNIGFSPCGEYWRQLRKICTVELLSPKRVQSFRSFREEEFSNLCKWIASKQGSLINLTEKISLTTCDVVMQASLGNKSDQLASFIPIVSETMDLLARFSISIADLYPSINLFRVFSGVRGRAERLHKIADHILENIINDHKVANDECKQREDLLDVLLKFNDVGHELHLTTENIKAVLLDIFTAGIETSSTTTNWAMTEMMKHPTVLEKAQDEVRRVFNTNGFVDESKLSELKYLKLIIKETLRMHPAAPLLPPRESSECCEIHGYKIPKKTWVILNTWAIGRDQNYWNDADNFIPERFLDNPIDYKGGANYEYLPFGAGRRICPGTSFGLANVELPLAMFLYHFDWVLPPGIKPENVDTTKTVAMTGKRKNPLYVTPVIKYPLHVK